jgi:tetratricopeptide (TPR) repeat protein
LSVHRLTQEAFLYNEYGLLENTRLQAAFDGLVFLLDHRFPGYGREKSLLDQWDICARYLPHVSALTRVFKKFLNSDSPSGRIRSSEAFVGLLTKASWYLQEIGDLRACSNLLQIACDACEDKTSLIYAYLCNTHVVVAVDENDMSKAQKYSTKAIAIRENRLASDDLDLAISYNNYGIALLNEGRYDESLANLMLSDSIWADTGLDDETYKALTYLNTGRVYSLKGDVDLAIPYFKKAEITFSRISNNVFLIG